MAKDSRELNEIMLTKKTENSSDTATFTDTDNHSPSEGKARFPAKNRTPSRPWHQSYIGILQSLPLGKDTELEFSVPFFFSLGPLRKSWGGLHPNNSELEAFNMEFLKLYFKLNLVHKQPGMVA